MAKRGWQKAGTKLIVTRATHTCSKCGKSIRKETRAYRKMDYVGYDGVNFWRHAGTLKTTYHHRECH